VYYDADLRFALLAMSKSWAFDDHINTRLVTQLLYWVSGVANNRRMERIGDVISRTLFRAVSRFYNGSAFFFSTPPVRDATIVL